MLTRPIFFAPLATVPTLYHARGIAFFDGLKHPFDSYGAADVYCSFGFSKRLVYGKREAIYSSSHQPGSGLLASSHAGEEGNYNLGCMHSTGYRQS